MRALSGAWVLAEDKLFATLDPITRRIKLPTGETVLLTDTVGFIQKLPTELVAAFRATLEELGEADVLLHVIDIAHPHAYEHTQTVDATLAELGVADRPRLLALNKVDLLRRPDGQPVAGLNEARALVYGAGSPPPSVVLVSAERRWGLDRLLEHVAAGLDGGLAVSASAPQLLGAHRLAEVHAV
jgi:GTP-binding protein HflX